jgi:hypothetical protein
MESMIEECPHCAIKGPPFKCGPVLCRLSTGANMRLISFSVHRWFEQAAGLTTLSYRLIHAVSQTVRDSRFVFHATGKLRRLGLVHFGKKYVQKQILVRGGDCRQCGVCCNLLFTCPMLTKNRRCLVYGACRPRSCKVFPIDQRDIDEVSVCGGHCGYFFPVEESANLLNKDRS